MDGMKRTRKEGGFFQATIRPFSEWDAPHQQVNVLFLVNKGLRARVGDVLVTGSPGYSAEEIRKIAELKTGDRVTAGQGAPALQPLPQRMQKQPRREAQGTLTPRVHPTQTQTFAYTPVFPPHSPMHPSPD